MLEIFNKKLSKAYLLKRVGNLSHFGGVKYYKFADGLSKGVRAADIKSPSGLDMTILIDRCMDISYLSYKSIPISWGSIVGETSPIYQDNRKDGYLKTFFGGLLTTCGLDNIGLECIDQGKEFNFHGRITNLPAENICFDSNWEKDKYFIKIKGKIRQVEVSGDKLELNREITAFLNRPEIVIEDTVENVGFNRSPVMILYHVNVGFPIIDKNSELIEGKAKVTPLNEAAKKGFKNFSKFSGPVSNFNQQVFLHEIQEDEDGYAKVALINLEFDNNKGIGVCLSYKKNTLPFLMQWKQLKTGEYTCGLEPSNSTDNREISRKDKTLKFIEPGERINYKIKISVIDANDKIKILKNKLRIEKS